MLRAGVVGAALGLAGCPSDRSRNDADQRRRIGDGSIQYVGAGESLQAAIDDSPNGSTVWLLNSYDEAADTFPVTIRNKVVIQGSSHSDVNLDGAGETVFVVDHGGSNRYPGVRFNGVHVRNAGVGFDIADARYVTLENCLVESMRGRGIQIGPNATNTDPIATLLSRVTVEDCGGDGVYLADTVHGTTLFECALDHNGGHGLNMNQSATVTLGVLFGSAQYNDGYGIRYDGPNNGLIRGTYFEDNDTGDTADLYVNNCLSLGIENCYFNGQRETESAILAASPGGSSHVDVQTCRFRNYAGAAISLQAAEYWDIHAGTHSAYNCAGGLFEDDAYAVRSDGVLLPRNLANRPGAFIGDRAISDGTNTTEGMLCTWVDTTGDGTGDAWQPADGGPTI